MKVKLLTGRVEVDQDGRAIEYAPGDVVTLEDRVARLMIERGSAEPVGKGEGSGRAAGAAGRETR